MCIRDRCRITAEPTFEIVSVNFPVIRLQMLEESGDDAAGNSLMTVFNPTRK